MNYFKLKRNVVDMTRRPPSVWTEGTIYCLLGMYLPIAWNYCIGSGLWYAFCFNR